jgi:DNA-binding NtrC family response regulator
MARILVVDDEDEVRSSVERRLRREGYQVDLADSPETAFELITTADPSYDLVVTDMVMSEPDSGVRVLESALARDLLTEVIVLTAYGSVANAVECMKRGAYDYVEKNIPGVDVYELLVMKVAAALDRRRTSVAALRRIESLNERVRAGGPAAAL